MANGGPERPALSVERYEIESVRRVQEPATPAGQVRAAELPDDPPSPHVDDDDPIAEVVVDRDQMFRYPHRQRRMIELPRP